MKPPTPVKLILGAVFGFLLLPCGGLGAAMMATPGDAKEFEAGAVVFGLSLAVWGIPAVVLLTLGLRVRRYEARLKRLAAMGAASAKLPLDQVASELGVTASAARSLILDAVGKGILVGRLDLEHGMFLSGTTTGAVRQLAMTCRNCHAHSSVVVSPGSATVCPFCGFRMA